MLLKTETHGLKSLSSEVQIKATRIHEKLKMALFAALFGSIEYLHFTQFYRATKKLLKLELGSGWKHLERARLASQIQGLRILDRRGWKKNKAYFCMASNSSTKLGVLIG